MPNRRLTRTEVRRTLVDWDYVSGQEDADDIVCIQLTKGQRRMLSAIVEYQRWPTRWYGTLPSEDTLNEYVDAIEAALEGEACNVPITDMRVQDCTLEVQYDGGPTWVTIGQFFPLDASCTIINTTNIEKNQTAIFTALALRNSNPSPSSATGVGVNLHAIGLDALSQVQAYIHSGWTDLSPQWRGRIKIGVYAGGAAKDILRVNPGNQAVLINQFTSIGNQQALRLSRFEGGYTSVRAVDILTGSRVLFGATWEGQAQAYKRTTINNASTPALLLEAWADGVTPAAGFGPGIDFQGQDSTSESQAMASINAVWKVATHASREAALRLRVRSYGFTGYPIEVAIVDQDTGIGFHQAAPVNQPVVTGTTEYDALTSLLEALDQYGLIQDNTAIVPDAGGGGDAMPTTELVQEIYQDMVNFPYGYFPFLSNDVWGIWTPSVGWHEGTSGFRIQQNFNAGIQFCFIRLVFDYLALEELTIWVGFDQGQSNEYTILEDVLPVETIFTNRAYTLPVFVRPDSTAPLQIWVLGTLVPTTDYQIVVTSIDMVVRGLASLESDFLAIEEDQTPPHRIARYVDLTDSPYAFVEAAGGTTPPDLELEPQV